VHYKLDLGIDHVLVDEAQDTSHKQWDIVRRLTAEFTAGAGARASSARCSLVGDEKQSIYSFQHAAPKEFASMRRYFKSAHDRAAKFVESKFEHSFRSGEAILAPSTRCSSAKDLALSVTSDRRRLSAAHRLAGCGRAWSKSGSRKSRTSAEIEGWDAPFDAVNETSPRVKLARRIARAVRAIGRRWRRVLYAATF
jgi:ATP-dependent helicase/nuclease subunit A